MSNIDLDIAKNLRLKRVKKYWEYTGQVEIKLNYLYDWIFILTIFVRHLQRVKNSVKIWVLGKI